MSRIAIVTGAGSGIGRAVSLALNSAGYSVVLAGRRNAELEGTAALAERRHGSMIAVPTDITQPEAVAALFDRTREAFGRLDLLFQQRRRRRSRHSNRRSRPIEQWQRGGRRQPDRRVPLRPAGHPPDEDADSRAADASSTTARSPRTRRGRNSAPYTATKHAITGLTKSISLDGRKYDIACGQIDIGNAATEMTERMATGVAAGQRRKRGRAAHGCEAWSPTRSVYMAELPLEANVQFMTIMATKMPFIGRG